MQEARNGGGRNRSWKGGGQGQLAQWGGWAELDGLFVAGRRAGHQAGSRGKASHKMAYEGVGFNLSYTGLVRRGRRLASPAPSANIVTSRTARSSSAR